MEIQELPDYKARCYETEKYLDEPLLEYVWIVANHFFLEYDGQDYSESRRPSYLLIDILKANYLMMRNI